MALRENKTAMPLAKGDATTDPETRRRFGKLVGLLYLIGGLSSIPSSLLVEPSPSPLIIPVTAFAITGGIAWLLFPWERANARLLHAVVAAGTLAVGLAIVAAGPTYAFYAMLIAVFVAYAFHSRTAVAAHLALLIVAILAPIAIDPDMTRQGLQAGFLVIPNLVVAATLIVFLRERSEARERSFRDFAEQALELTSRIRSGPHSG